MSKRESFIVNLVKFVYSCFGSIVADIHKLSTELGEMRGNGASWGEILQGDLGSMALRISLPTDRNAVQKALRQVQFWRFDLMARVRNQALTSQQIVAITVQYLAVQMRWRTIMSRKSSSWVLHEAVETRESCPLITAMLLQFILGDEDFEVTPLSLKQSHIARLTNGVHCFYVNLWTYDFLDEQNLLNALHGEGLARPFSLPLVYAEECLLVLLENQDDRLALGLVNYLCEQFPRRMDLVAQRAMLQHRHGSVASALKDLKRFFAFHPEHKAPRDLVRIYRRLSSHFLRGTK